MVAWATINSFLFPIGLFVLRNGYTYYRNLQQTYHLRKPHIQPLSPSAARALNLLSISALVALLSTLPFFTPENIFTLTNARIQTNIDVVFTRLAATRPLTSSDELLKSKLASTDGRLLYFVYGADVLANCAFCKTSDPSSYLYYALPALLTPHLLHLLVLGLVTSTTLSGPQGAHWRSPATLLGVGLAAAELYYISSYELTANLRALRTPDIDFFHWRLRLLRGLCIAAADALLGWVMWLSATNRFFLRTASPAERLVAATAVLEVTNGRLQASGWVRNAVARDRELRDRLGGYWGEEKEVYEEREVVDATRAVLERLDVQALTRMAEMRADQAVNSLPGLQQQQQPG